MATFLEICQNVARECGVAGGADASPKPTAVTGQVGELNRIVNWVADAYVEIQGSRDWRWLRKKFTLDTVDGTKAYAFGTATDVDTAAAITRFKSWDISDRLNAPKLYLTSAGVGSEVFISFVPWDSFEHLYETGALQTQTSQPIHVTVNNKDELQFGITPNDIYTFTSYYNMSAQILAADSDTPEMPAAYHDLIKYQAMYFYGVYESAPEVIMRAEKGIRRLTNQLNKNQATHFRRGRHLA